MKKSLFAVASAITILASGSVSAQTSMNGPYYANPSWDQQLPAAQRFIVLQNWNNEAVLDRETGLVWERVPTGNATWISAFTLCRNHATGNRIGWRLPSEEELSSLLDGTTKVLPVGHPFQVGTAVGYWTATSDEQDSTQAWFVRPSEQLPFFPAGPDVFTKVVPVAVWCVRGGSGVANPPY
jgi:hypothetical protein